MSYDDEPVTYLAYLDARCQEESHATLAALRAAGVEISLDQLLDVTSRCQGYHSQLTLLICVGTFFRTWKGNEHAERSQTP